MAEVARPRLSGPPVGVWRFERERPARRWRHYYCAAVASDGGDELRLVCEWSPPLYILNVTGGDLEFVRFLFADEDCGDVVRRVMRIARRDVARRLARLDHLHGGVVIGVSKICAARRPARAEPDVAADDGDNR